MVEIFDVVDEDDNVIGKATRKEVHDKKLIHRSVMFFILDKKGRVFVTQRTKTKDMFPEYWSVTFGGHVDAGESYDDAVVREAREEAKIEGKPIFLRSFKKRIPEEKENSRVYAFVTDKMPKIDKEELKQGKFMTIEEIYDLLKNERFLPETKGLLKILREFQS
ncbi:MAG: NUDIX domain-containing protein [Candidatus Aenigmarchaeota archaeon]|nr:NUDIX domain-containing protein [Candidatus Aenigmarchaeota archaeon]